ncbi:MAG TPA: hypothetical protein VGB14_09765 [Acidimicrobiales bacterium]|jgi:hypothetical protein
MSRYSERDGRLRVRFLTAEPADLDAPTVTALNAGVNLMGVKNGEAMAAINGWEVAGSTMPVPDGLSFQTGNIPSEVTYPESNFEFYRDPDVHTIYDALDEGTAGWVAFVTAASPTAPIAAGDEVDVWPVEVLTRNKLRTLANEPAKYRVMFSTGVPTLNGVVAAAA